MLAFTALALCRGFAQDTTPIQAKQAEQVTKFVIRHMQRYYMTHHVIGMPSSAVPEKVSIDIEKTAPVDGWSNRYRVSGNAMILTAALYAPNYSCTFEVDAAIDSAGDVQILNIESDREKS